MKDVYVDLNELIPRITSDHRIQKKIEEPLSINIFTVNASGGGKSTTEIN